MIGVFCLAGAFYKRSTSLIEFLLLDLISTRKENPCSKWYVEGMRTKMEIAF